MRFADSVVMFEAFSIPMVGDTIAGHLVGLTPEGAAVCRRMLAEEVDEADIAAADEALLAHFKGAGHVALFEGKPAAPCVLRSAYLHVTQTCNLHCVGCYSEDDARNRAPDLPLEELQRIIEALAQAGVVRLIVSGGEPFLRPDLPQIVQHAKEAGIANVDVLTNGTCVLAEVLERMAPFVDRVSVSFDGCSAESAAQVRRTQLFDTLVDAVQMIKDAGIAAHIIPTIHRLNVDDIPAYAALADQLGATMNFSLLSCPADDAVAQLAPDDAALKKLAAYMAGQGACGPIQVADAPVSTGLRVSTGCGAGCSGVSVGYDGRAYPCHMLHDDAVALGALTGDAPDAECLADLERFHVDAVDECRACEIKYLCGGGCRARAYHATGSLRGRDPYCALMKEYYALVFKKLSGQ
ncbi:radical SAM/SPASM domain-containing protein [Adlercreutzia murintestinalis]|uniref:radical SAM/SPASM domain-containing protein n=1 Tax=Adlercreutzia murintestinalis TaxID=2941325 RepID=UPI00203BC48F|nr:radical SAM protein [Adlercreutzia murintestinalis]